MKKSIVDKLNESNPAWVMARDVIAEFERQGIYTTPLIAKMHAETILCRLAAHDPPLLVTIVQEEPQ